MIEHHEDGRDIMAVVNTLDEGRSGLFLCFMFKLGGCGSCGWLGQFFTRALITHSITATRHDLSPVCFQQYRLLLDTDHFSIRRIRPDLRNFPATFLWRLQQVYDATYKSPKVGAFH